MPRTPLALANWKMSMNIAESLDFAREFQALAGDLLGTVEVILCPPFTSLWALASAQNDDSAQEDGQDTDQPSAASRPTPHAPRIPIQLGAQDMAPTTAPARTGSISAALLADVGCRWVMLGHWEVRRHLGDDDATVNRKLHLAIKEGLRPALFVGEARDEAASVAEALEGQLALILAGCTAEQVATMVFVYEPEGAIGVDAPTSPEHVTDGCTLIRSWLRCQWGEAAAERLRIIYGGSVAPEFAPELMTCPDLDGLAATRRGRDPATFAEIVRLIAGARSQQFAPDA